MSWPRPFVVGFILLMVFLSMSGEGPSNLTTDELSTDSSAIRKNGAADTQGNEKDIAKKGVKEQIIYDLSLSNEKLEHEIMKYRQYVLDLRRAVRAAPGCSVADDSILTLYPELHEDLDRKEVDESDEKRGENDGEEASSKEAAGAGGIVATAVDVDEQQQHVDNGGTKKIDSASIRLQNGRLSKDNSSAATTTSDAVSLPKTTHPSLP